MKISQKDIERIHEHAHHHLNDDEVWPKVLALIDQYQTRGGYIQTMSHELAIRGDKIRAMGGRHPGHFDLLAVEGL